MTEFSTDRAFHLVTFMHAYEAYSKQWLGWLRDHMQSSSLGRGAMCRRGRRTDLICDLCRKAWHMRLADRSLPEDKRRPLPDPGECEAWVSPPEPARPPLPSFLMGPDRCRLCGRHVSDGAVAFCEREQCNLRAAEALGP